MTDVPVFFVPNVKDETDEEVLAELASFAGVSVPGAESRIYSIEFEHDGEIWSATVGLRLEGLKNERVSGSRVLSEYERRVSDPATVLAIISDSPTVVITDAIPIGHIRSKWNNPFYAGQVKKTVKFSE